MSDFTLDTSTFQAGLKHKLANCKKAEADILNRAGGSICANAIRLTPGADKSAIQTVLTTNGLAMKLLQSPSFQSRLPRKFAGTAHRKLSRAELNDLATRFIKSRQATGKYIAAGFFKALAVFRPGSKRRVSDKGLAGQGTAKRATASDLIATLENHARGAGKIALAPLQQAIDQEGAFMLGYGKDAIAKALNS